MPVEAPSETTVEPSDEHPTLPGVVTRTPGGNIAFSSKQKTEYGIPIISSVWTDSLTARAQEAANKRGVPLQQIVVEWETAWAANG